MKEGRQKEEGGGNDIIQWVKEKEGGEKRARPRG
jgi:hypothetical protein